MWIAIFAFSLQACDSQDPIVELIPQTPFSGISSMYFSTTHSFYSFSGLDVNGNYLNLLQNISLDNAYKTWRFDEVITGNNPDPRSNYGAFLYNNSYYIFGGIGQNTIFNDMWQFDITYRTWNNVVGVKPLNARHSFAFTSFTGTDNIFYFAVLGGKSYSNSVKLTDFYLYRPDTNSWIIKSDYTACSSVPLIGAQLQYNNGTIYLFSGASIGNNMQNYYTSICLYNIKTNTWKTNSIYIPNFGSSHGGSCLYNGYIYNFFGGSFQRNTSYVLSDITRLALNNISAGWIPITISNTRCSDEVLARNSFGFNCYKNDVYIVGGNSISGAQNSIINITLDNSESTLECNALYDERLWPRKRHASSLIYVTGGMYLFGGIDQGVIMNDLWFYNITSNIWAKITPLGNLPTPRYGHAAASQGNYIVIVGGMGFNGEYLQDYYYYRIDLNTWSEIVPVSNLPPPIFRPCLVLNLPYFYYIGGQEEFQITSSIWQYDFTNSEFTQIYVFNPSTDIPVYKHSCFLLPTNDSSSYLIVGPGSTTVSDMPSCAIQTFNLTSKPISKSLLYLDDSLILCRTDLIFTYIGYDIVLLAGGQDFNQEVFSDIWAVNLTTGYHENLGNFNFTIYSSAYSYINQTLYIYSGLSESVVSIYTTSSDYFQIFHLDFSSILQDTPCGLGMFENDGVCEFCPAGSYSGINRNDLCYTCPVGTASTRSGGTDLSQCIPCPFGYYSIPPSDQCIKCNSAVETCYIGTGAYSVNETVSKTVKDFYNSKSQPGFYKPKDISKEVIILYTVTACIIGAFIISFGFCNKMRLFLTFYDFYKNAHLEKYGETVEQDGTAANDYVQKEKLLGGFCTGITLILIFYLTVNSILAYVRINYIENVVLVPIDSLLKEKDFHSQHFTLDLMLPSYGDACSQSSLIASFVGDFDPFAIKEMYRDGAICYAVLKFKSNDVIASGEFIELEFTEFFSFTSEIYISLSTDSSNPGKISRVVQNISSNAGNVLRGTTPTVFSFSVLPSMYSHTNLLDPHYEVLGYRLSSTVLPVVGSQVTVNDIGVTQNLKIRLEFLRSDIGITTFKYPIIGPIDFFFSIINNFPGTIGLIAIGVWLAEYFWIHKRNTGRFKEYQIALNKMRVKSAEDSSASNEENKAPTEREPLINP